MNTKNVSRTVDDVDNNIGIVIDGDNVRSENDSDNNDTISSTVCLPFQAPIVVSVKERCKYLETRCRVEVAMYHATLVLDAVNLLMVHRGWSDRDVDKVSDEDKKDWWLDSHSFKEFHKMMSHQVTSLIWTAIIEEYNSVIPKVPNTRRDADHIEYDNDGLVSRCCELVRVECIMEKLIKRLEHYHGVLLDSKVRDQWKEEVRDNYDNWFNSDTFKDT